MEEIFELRNITKRFGSVLANDNVNLRIMEGEVHSIVGENGAGKSTLMNILYGMLQPDSGAILYRGRPAAIRSSHDAIAMGIGMVHQHFMLVPSLSVMENIVLGLPPDGEKIWRPARFRARLQALLRDFGLSVPLDAKVGGLTVGMMQRVEIVKTLYRGANLIILDEPTAMLTPQETQELFNTVRLLVKNGHTIVFISHKLREVMQISDRITALRGGRTIRTVDRREVTAGDVARMMIGYELEPIRKPAGRDGGISLKVENLCVGGENGAAVQGLSFELHKGEVLGIAGVEGNGQDELADAVVGVRRAQSGRITFDGEELAGRTVRERMRSGLAHIPQDRIAQGLALSLPIYKNIILGAHDRKPLQRRGLIDWRAARRLAGELIGKYAVKTPGGWEKVGNLSGGNMQKVVVAREFAQGPKLVVACQPTRGVDIGSSKFIHERLLEVRNAGGSVLLISADLDEIIEMSDRILVMYEGRKMGILDAGEATEERLGALMFGKTEVKDGDGPP